MKTQLRFTAKAIIIIVLAILLRLTVHAQWSAPVDLSPAAVSAGMNESMGSCFGVSRDTLHVVWTDKLSTTTAALYYSRSNDTGLVWSNPIRITALNGNAWNPAIAVNGKNIHVAWREINPLNNRRASWYKHSTDGGLTWGPNIFLDSTADWPGISVSGNKVYIVNDVITSNSPYNTEIFFLRSLDNGTTWSAPQQLTFAIGRSEDESIYAQGDRIHMSWNDNRVGQFQILYKESSDYGLTWGPDVVVHPVKDYNVMGWSNANHVDVVACGAPAGNYQLILAQSADSGATWGSSMNLSNDPTHTYFLPDMVRDGADLHVVCSSSAGAKYFHSADGGTTWALPYTFNGSQTFVAYAYCTLHIVFVNAGHIYYIRNATGNAGHCLISDVAEQKNNSLSVSVYPNPFSSDATLKINGAVNNSELKVYDVLGNEVMNRKNINSSEIRIERGQLKAGIYFYNLNSENINGASGKFIIE